MGEQTRNHFGDIEETLTLNVSGMFPRLCTQATYLADADLCLGSKNATLTQNVSAAMFPRLCTQATYLENAEFAFRKQKCFASFPFAHA